MESQFLCKVKGKGVPDYTLQRAEPGICSQQSGIVRVQFGSPSYRQSGHQLTAPSLCICHPHPVFTRQYLCPVSQCGANQVRSTSSMGCLALFGEPWILPLPRSTSSYLIHDSFLPENHWLGRWPPYGEYRLHLGIPTQGYGPCQPPGAPAYTSIPHPSRPHHPPHSSRKLDWLCYLTTSETRELGVGTQGVDASLARSRPVSDLASGNPEPLPPKGFSSL